ncbi:hypothetical protein [Rheinheimera oceanensis]|uniref:hypothetical protein n=1 Tax=Rheinheimera oceanensis TaxID=2817449 RepID=UPI001BFE5BD1|nr:hypothetical protein [Rheinheimera oceanensis]
MKFVFSLCLLVTSQVFATTWVESTVPDPIAPDSTCSVMQPASYGSYIYHWPSKYDQVFWPLTDSNGIWFCKESGFIAFIEDFEGLSEEEVARIRSYLKTAKPNISDQLSRLEHLDKIYSLRDKDEIFKNKLKRVLAYLYEAEGEFDLANRHRSEILQQINKLLESPNLTEYQTLEYLYLSVNYELQLGNEERSSSRLIQLKIAIENINDAELKGYGDYLSALINELPSMKPGGKLMPE